MTILVSLLMSDAMNSEINLAFFKIHFLLSTANTYLIRELAKIHTGVTTHQGRVNCYVFFFYPLFYNYGS